MAATRWMVDIFAPFSSFVGHLYAYNFHWKFHFFHNFSLSLSGNSVHFFSLFFYLFPEVNIIFMPKPHISVQYDTQTVVCAHIFTVKHVRRCRYSESGRREKHNLFRTKKRASEMKWKKKCCGKMKRNRKIQSTSQHSVTAIFVTVAHCHSSVLFLSVSSVHIVTPL